MAEVEKAEVEMAEVDKAEVEMAEVEKADDKDDTGIVVGQLSTMSNPHSECLRVEKGKLIFPRIPQGKDGHLGLDRGSSSAKESSER
ncbi:hypothetical protein LWI29_005270 [Acer saccharum]|uniref:Uncharacterized protein n=1 Tax=Acer saccharum TaxID=4024 RepID=A0AA39UPS6_ACESA|nr:hypothetical protein LWI29_005270 [Acer saccharum]